MKEPTRIEGQGRDNINMQLLKILSKSPNLKKEYSSLSEEKGVQFTNIFIGITTLHDSVKNTAQKEVGALEEFSAHDSTVSTIVKIDEEYVQDKSFGSLHKSREKLFSILGEQNEKKKQNMAKDLMDGIEVHTQHFKEAGKMLQKRHGELKTTDEKKLEKFKIGGLPEVLERLVDERKRISENQSRDRETIEQDLFKFTSS